MHDGVFTEHSKIISMIYINVVAFAMVKYAFEIPNHFFRKPTTLMHTLESSYCHTPIPDPTRLTDPNRVSRRETELGLFFFFFKAELVHVGMTHILEQNKNVINISKKLPPEWCPSKSIHIYRVSFTNTKLCFYIYKSQHGTYM